MVTATSTGRRAVGLARAGAGIDRQVDWSDYETCAYEKLEFERADRLSYLAAAPDFRLLDTELARLDELLFGFEWDAAARWVADRPMLDQVLRAA